jgi:8-oxo-dGTP pyrophosphatase MutT (NUDIX family)
MKYMPHIHDLIDFTVDVFIVHQNKVLLIFHKKLSMWLQIGGHIELDEDPEQALFREVKEECGLEVEVVGEKQPSFEVIGTKFLYTPSYMNIHNINETHRHVGLVYFAKVKSGEVIFNQKEHKDIRWFNKEDLENPEFKLNEAVAWYAKKALEVIK